MAAFTSNIDITSGGTYNMNITNGEPASQVATDLNGKFANIQRYLQNGLPEVWTGESLPDSLPSGKILFYNSLMYSGSTSGQASSTVGFTFKVTFDSVFQGKTWTLTGGTTTLTGIVPSNNYTEITVSELGTTFNLTCNGVTIQVTSAQYYGYSSVIFKEYFADFNANTWGRISAVSQKGIAANVWNAGATKTIHIQGTIGTLTVNQDVQVFIIGINHNSAREGTNRIHIQIGKNTSGNPIAFCDSKYNTGVSSTGYFSMNSSHTNNGGWNATQMKNTILHSGTTPSNTGGNTFMSVLPSDLRAVMQSCIKYTDNTGGGKNNSSYVTATTEYLPLLAEFEVFGANGSANSAEQNYQSQYDYYKAGNSKVFNDAGTQTSAVYWWLRSPSYNSGSNFCIVDNNGNSYFSNAYGSIGVSPVFFV